MAVNSRIKGKVGELEACKAVLEHLGLEGRRSQQHCATDSASDILVNGTTDSLWWEVKRVQKLNVTETMARAKKDCGEKLPIVLHRRNHTPWLATVALSDLAAICHAIINAQQQATPPTPPTPQSQIPTTD